MNERPETGWRTDPRLRQTRTILLDKGDPEGKRAEILQYFHDTYDIDESLFEMLKYDETFYRRADPLRHPLIFYFGHTAALLHQQAHSGEADWGKDQPDLRIHVRRGCG
jgi:hypothetical protein